MKNTEPKCCCLRISNQNDQRLFLELDKPIAGIKPNQKLKANFDFPRYTNVTTGKVGRRWYGKVAIIGSDGNCYKINLRDNVVEKLEQKTESMVKVSVSGPELTYGYIVIHDSIDTECNLTRILKTDENVKNNIKTKSFSIDQNIEMDQNIHAKVIEYDDKKKILYCQDENQKGFKIDLKRLEVNKFETANNQ